MFGMIKKMLRTGIVTEPLVRQGEPIVNHPLTDEKGKELAAKIKQVLGHSLHIRHLDSGSSNGCEYEMMALLNPIYDLQRFGIDFVASPRHADMLLVTGGVTRNLERAVRSTIAGTPKPKMVVAIGNCACGTGLIGPTYAQIGELDKLVPVTVYVPGCPPTPWEMATGILMALDKLGAYLDKR